MSRFGMPAVASIAFVSTMTAAPPLAAAVHADALTAVRIPQRLQTELEITVPDTRALLSGTPGGQITRALTTVTVRDTRAGSTGSSWVATVSATSFTTGGKTAAETVPSSAVSYWSGPATATGGPGTFTPGQANASAAQSLNVTRTAFSHTQSLQGENSASWNPTIVVSVPSGAVAGTYTGTVTHSVA